MFKTSYCMSFISFYLSSCESLSCNECAHAITAAAWCVRLCSENSKFTFMALYIRTVYLVCMFDLGIKCTMCNICINVICLQSVLICLFLLYLLKWQHLCKIIYYYSLNCLFSLLLLKCCIIETQTQLITQLKPSAHDTLRKVFNNYTVSQSQHALL